jgi:hypothetical protein
MKRAQVAQKHWELWRSLLQEGFDFAAPQRDTFRFWSPGQRKNRHIFDATAVDGLVTYANRIQGSVVPSWQEWMNLAAGTEIPEEEKQDINKDLEQSTETFFSTLNHSNFSTEITPAFSDYGVSTGGIQIEEGEFGLDEDFIFTNIPLAELYPELPPRGAIESSWRKQEVEARHIERIWPNAEISPQLKEIIKNNPDQKQKLLNGHLFNPKDRLYWQIVIHKAEKKLIFTQSFKTKRVIVFRNHVTPGEVFGRGPILTKLPDIRTANKVKQFILENAAIQMSGMYTGVDDGIFNPYTARIAPGIILPVRSNASANPSLRALDRAGDIGIGGIILEDLQEGIKKALFADPLGEVTDPVKSATEQMLRTQEALKNRGASFGRLKSELIEPLVKAGVDILQGLGKMPEISVNGKEVTIKHTSPLAKAENLEDFQNSQVWFSNVGQLPEAVVAATVKVEDLPRYWQEKLDVPADLVRTKTETKQVTDLITTAAQAGIQGGTNVGSNTG